MEAKEKILKNLKELGALSSSRIAGIIGIDYNYAMKLLTELLEEDKIKKNETPNSIYWEIKEKQDE